MTDFEAMARAIMDDILRWQSNVRGGYAVSGSATDRIAQALRTVHNQAIEAAAKVAEDMALAPPSRWGEGATFNARKIALKARALKSEGEGKKR